jgi:glycine cleavage system regulatory protein
MSKSFVLSFSAQDKPGIVEQISNTVSANGGNWLESAMSHLAGRFVGIVVVDADASKESALSDSLKALSNQGLTISFEPMHAEVEDNDVYQSLEIELTGHDRPGIVSEISAVLAKHNANVEDLSTELVSGSMSAEMLFKADIHVTVKQGSDLDDLQDAIEAIADDLMVDMHLEA